jgi:Antitoxin-like ribbon-helix-helix
MTRRPDLANVLADAGGSRRAPPAPKLAIEQSAEKQAYTQPGRAGTKPITGHFPKQVRDELKKLAIERDTTLHLLMAEAFNDLFTKYGKPEIAPLEKGKS